MKRIFNLVFILSMVLIINSMFSCNHNLQTGKVMFQDALNGEYVNGWRIGPKNFTDLSGYGKVYVIKSKKSGENEFFAQNTPWVGDESWENYRIEIEVYPTGGHWVGMDFHVQDDGESGFNVCFFTFDSTRTYILEAMDYRGGYDGACAWKLWPVSQKSPLIEKGKWLKLRIDVGETIANIYMNDFSKPVFTVYDIPFSKGGVRFFSLSEGKAYLRDFKVTSLSKGYVKPILEDIWKNVRNSNIVRNWKVTTPQRSDFGLNGIPDEINSPGMKWIDAETDERGVVNVGALFPDNNIKGTVLAKTNIESNEEKISKAWVTYTDRCAIWCNGKKIFKGPKRGWNDPESNYDCRIKPDHFEFQLPLKKGNNTILLRSEVLERWGWGFQMRLE